MKSKLTIDFQGLDCGANSNQFEPVIRAIVEDSEDVRDGLMKAFFQQLKHRSNWLRVDIYSHSEFTNDGKQTMTITPIKPEELKSTIETMLTRLNLGESIDSKKLLSNIQLDDKVLYTDSIGKQSDGIVVGVIFRPTKTLYEIADNYTGKTILDIDSNNIEKFVL